MLPCYLSFSIGVPIITVMVCGVVGEYGKYSLTYSDNKTSDL